MGPYTKLAVRTLGPATGLTLEAHAQVPTYVPNSPSRGTRKHGSARPDDGRWWEQGPCARQGHDSVWLQPSKFTKAEAHAAAALCATCPVRVPCSAQPYPHVGITAGKIHWDGTPATEVKLCDQCLEPSKKRFCSDKCRDRWYYLARVEEGEQPYEPLRRWFGRKPVTQIARECGVAVRTVYRWEASGAVPAGAVRQLTKRLGVDIETIWPDTNVVGLQTSVRSAATIGSENSEETGSVGTAPASSKEPSDSTGGPLMKTIDQPSTPVKSPGAR